MDVIRTKHRRTKGFVYRMFCFWERHRLDVIWDLRRCLQKLKSGAVERTVLRKSSFLEEKRNLCNIYSCIWFWGVGREPNLGWHKKSIGCTVGWYLVWMLCIHPPLFLTVAFNIINHYILPDQLRMEIGGGQYSVILVHPLSPRIPPSTPVNPTLLVLQSLPDEQMAVVARKVFAQLQIGCQLCVPRLRAILSHSHTGHLLVGPL